MAISQNFPSIAPSLSLNFASSRTLDPRITFTRTSSATCVGPNGLLRVVSANEPRFDHNPTTGESLGLLVEEQRTNLLLNSATLSTQSVTVAAAANALSFYGTGTVTLTGVSTAGPLVGTGANNRVSLTFTPTVGVLILTVSGSVTNAQLEAGAFPTSYIPTTTAAATRNADVASITGSAFSSWYRQDEGTVFIEYRDPGVSGGIRTPYAISDGTDNNRIQCFISGTTTLNNRHVVASVSSNPGGLFTAINSLNRHAIASAVGSCNAASNGTLATASTPAAMPVVNRLNIGINGDGTGDYLNAPVARITYWPQRLSDSTLQALTK